MYEHPRVIAVYHLGLFTLESCKSPARVLLQYLVYLAQDTLSCFIPHLEDLALKLPYTKQSFSIMQLPF